jgi:hypothetical protein
MDIRGVGHRVLQSVGFHLEATDNPGRNAAAQAGPALREQSASPADDAVTAPPEEENSSDSGTKGVLRLLEAGHFRGVADVRLRINFFDALSAKDFSDARQAVQTGAESLISGVDDNLGELTQAMAADPNVSAGIDDLGKTFQHDVQTLLDAFLESQGRDSTALADSIRSAFTTLVDGLRSGLTPATEAPADTAAAGADQPPADSVPPFDLEAALTSLTNVFDGLLGGMMDSLNGRTTLSDPSAPDGNGKAYEKFLQVYNEMRSIRQDPTPPAGSSLEIIG